MMVDGEGYSCLFQTLDELYLQVKTLLTRIVLRAPLTLDENLAEEGQVNKPQYLRCL